MRERKFLVGLGTILIIGGIYCFRAAFSKSMPVKSSSKIGLCLGGALGIAAGVYLAIISFPSLSA